MDPVTAGDGDGAWPHRGIPVVDGHVHVNRFDCMKPGPKAVIRRNPTFALMESFVHDPDAFLAHMDQEGIWQAWLINYCARDVMGYGREVNPWIADWVQADPERLVPVGGYDPRRDGDGAKAIDGLRDLGIRVLKIHPVHQRLSPAAHRQDDRLRAAYRRCEERRMPVVIHTGTSVFPGADNRFQDVAPIGQVLEDFADLPVVLAHGGRPDQCGQALRLLRRFGNAWLDFSSLPPKRIPEWFGDVPAMAGRCLWGSDWPGPKVPGMGANVASFLDLGYPDDVNRAVLHDNAVRLLDRVV